MFKIGRPLRFIYVLRQPQRSWMSREAWVAGLLFPLALSGAVVRTAGAGDRGGDASDCCSCSARA